jgi:predicted dehydrogenase
MPQPNQPVTAIIAGAGGRGRTYATFALENPDRLKIVGVSEPKEWNRTKMVEEHGIPANAVFTTWEDQVAQPKMADMVIISTQDAMHADPAVAFAKKGYAILLEKPMAPTLAECERIIRAVKENNTLFGVCHVMRYTSYTQALKKLLDEGAVGEIVTIQHLEPVGFWHQAHSFVRGNWRNTDESSFMLLAKSCHDLDWLRYIAGAKCRAVSSFGALKHFKKSEKPAAAGAALRCTACAYEPECPYSAKLIYLQQVESGYTGWPISVLTPEPTVESISAALEDGPYGRCVYECDNDVVDHQVVNLMFDEDRSAVFTMTAFNIGGQRKTRIFGTRGEIYGDGEVIEISDFLTREKRVVDTRIDDGTALSGHGGGDFGLIDRFVAAVASGDASLILSGPDESLETHQMVFASEQARLEHRVVDL